MNDELQVRIEIAAIGWDYEAFQKMVAPTLPTFNTLRRLMYLPEPTPFERGVLDRYQDKRRHYHDKR